MSLTDKQERDLAHLIAGGPDAPRNEKRDALARLRRIIEKPSPKPKEQPQKIPFKTKEMGQSIRRRPKARNDFEIEM